MHRNSSARNNDERSTFLIVTWSCSTLIPKNLVQDLVASNHLNPINLKCVQTPNPFVLKCAQD